MGFTALVLGATALAGAGVATVASSAGKAKADTVGNATPTAAQTVDGSSTSNLNNLGRAALIATSPQGVQGTDPSARFKLLGNSAGLGN